MCHYTSLCAVCVHGRHVFLPLQNSPPDQGCISQRFMQGTILALVIVMAFRYNNKKVVQSSDTVLQLIIVCLPAV